MYAPLATPPITSSFVVSRIGKSCRDSALNDGAWLSATRERLVADSARLDGLLRAAGFEVLGGTLLFRLARHPSAAVFVQRLGQHGIHIRAFADRPDQLRFGLPGNDEGFGRLAAALGVW